MLAVLALAITIVGVVWVLKDYLGGGIAQVGGAVGGVAGTIGGFAEEDITALHEGLETTVEFIGDELEQQISDATFHPDDNTEAILNFSRNGITANHWLYRYNMVQEHPEVLNYLPAFLRNIIAENYSSPLKGMQYFNTLAEPMQGHVEWTQTFQWLHNQVQIIAAETRG